MALKDFVSGDGAYADGWAQRLRRGAARLAVTLAIAGVLAGLAHCLTERGLGWGDSGGGRMFRDNLGQRFLARHQMARLAGALEIFRLERGSYPQKLEELVEAGLVTRRDLRYPWTECYYYRRKGVGGFVLLPPIE